MKAKIESLLSDRVANLANTLYLLVIVFLPTQLGKHFFIPESHVIGIRIDYLSPTLYVTDILIGLLFLVSLPHVVRVFARRLPALQPLFFVSLLLLATSLLFSLLFSERPVLVLYGLVKTVEMVFFGVYTYFFLKSGKQIAVFLFALSCGIVFESILSFIQVYSQSSIGGIFYVFGERTFSSTTPGIANASLDGRLFLRPYGTLPHPNVLAGYVLVGSVFLWSFRSYVSKTWLRRWISITLLLSSLCMLLTLSRIAIGLSLAFVLWQAWILRRIRLSRTLQVYIVMFVIGVLFLSSDILVPRFIDLFENSESLERRIQLIFVSVAMVKDNVFFGVGPLHFLVNLPFYIGASEPVLFLQPVHNIFLLLLSELGIVGVSGLVLFVWTVTRTMGIRNFVHDPLVWSILTILIVIGGSDHYFLTLQQGQLLLSLMIGVMAVRLKRLNYQSK